MKKRMRGTKANIEPKAILDRVCGLTAKHGFFGLSFQMIADDLGVSQSTIMHYYPSKPILIRALIDNVVLDNQASVSKLIKIEDDALTRLKNHFLGNLKWAKEKPEQASTILLLYYMGSVDKEFGDLYKRILAVARYRILEHILAAERESLIDLTMPADTAAEILQESLLASLLNIVATHSQFKIGEIEAKWNLLFKTILSVQGNPKSLRS